MHTEKASEMGRERTAGSGQVFKILCLLGKGR